MSNYTLFRENPLGLTTHQINSLETGLRLIALERQDHFIPGRMTEINDMWKKVGNTALANERVLNRDSIQNIINGHLNKSVGDFGGKGFFLGLVSHGIELELDEKTNLWKISKDSPKSVVEHVFTRNVAHLIMQYDYDIGVWDVDWDEEKRIKGISKGKSHIENVYPKLLSTTWTTAEENSRLNTIVLKKLDSIKKNNGNIPNMREIQTWLENAEHYKEAGIRFHPMNRRVSDTTYEQLIYPAFRKLITQHKLRKQKSLKRSTLENFGVVIKEAKKVAG